ncbi:MAG TPA: PH domain-containing protein, partial [Mycobacteriales bacterium]|nr:PH domain-containing protein [Mycobacteriales bacterium]
MANPTRYLLPTERVVINIRRHWAVLAGGTIQSAVLLIVGLLVARLAGSVGFLRMLAVYFTIFVVVRWIWSFFDWYVEKLIVTDKRVLLITGIVTRKVAIMPLVKVTDLTFNRSSTGLLLGYGQFVVETAGQDQALSSIDYVPRPERLYIQISELLFGGDKGAPGALVTSAQREAEEEAEQQARRRWRRFSPRRRRRDRDEPGAGPGPEQSSSDRLDDLLARRDTLLADREDPDFGRDQGFRDPDGEFDDDPHRR